jgi:hypothetical protein
MQAVLRRVERLEKENRQLRRAALAVAVLAAAVLGMGQARPTRMVEANRFLLKDSEGRVRAELSMESGKPTLYLRDEKGFPLVGLLGGDEPSLTLTRAVNEEQVAISARKEAYGLAVYGKLAPHQTGNGIVAGLGVTGGFPALSLFDNAGKERATVQVDELGMPALTLSDPDGSPRAQLILIGDTPILQLVRNKTKAHVRLWLGPDDPNLTLTDDEGYSTEIGRAGLVTPSTGETHQTSAASLVLFGKDGKVLWSAP